MATILVLSNTQRSLSQHFAIIGCVRREFCRQMAHIGEHTYMYIHVYTLPFQKPLLVMGERPYIIASIRSKYVLRKIRHWAYMYASMQLTQVFYCVNGQLFKNQSWLHFKIKIHNFLPVNVIRPLHHLPVLRPCHGRSPPPLPHEQLVLRLICLIKDNYIKAVGPHTSFHCVEILLYK